MNVRFLQDKVISHLASSAKRGRFFPRPPSGEPQNVLLGHVYRALNRWALLQDMEELNTALPAYVTKKAAEMRGIRIKPDAHESRIVVRRTLRPWQHTEWSVQTTDGQEVTVREIQKDGNVLAKDGRVHAHSDLFFVSRIGKDRIPFNEGIYLIPPMIGMQVATIYHVSQTEGGLGLEHAVEPIDWANALHSLIEHTRSHVPATEVDDIPHVVVNGDVLRLPNQTSYGTGVPALAYVVAYQWCRQIPMHRSHGDEERLAALHLTAVMCATSLSLHVGHAFDAMALLGEEDRARIVEFLGRAPELGMEAIDRSEQALEYVLQQVRGKTVDVTPTEAAKTTRNP